MAGAWAVYDHPSIWLESHLYLELQPEVEMDLVASMQKIVVPEPCLSGSGHLRY